jgi:hypothetical protein
MSKYKNTPTIEIVGGKTCHFRSLAEYKLARYLEILKHSYVIIEWQYELQRFYFPDVNTSPHSYLPDFTVTVNGPDGPECELWEVKGPLLSGHITRFKRMDEYHPDAFDRMYIIFESHNKDREKKPCYRTLKRMEDRGLVGIKFLGPTYRKLGIK